jgi:hypothetical protein
VGEIMTRFATDYEKVLLDIIKEHNTGFFYEKISRNFDSGEFVVKAEKAKEEMVGRAEILFYNGGRIHYEIRYNRVTNLNEGYVLSF